MQEQYQNGFNLEEYLAKAPSEEVRNEMIVRAVEGGLTNNVSHLERAVEILENKNKYFAIGTIYSKERSPIYDSKKAADYYRKAAELLNFRRKAEEEISSFAVYKEMGRKSFKGIKAVLKFFGRGHTFPTSVRKKEKILPEEIYGEDGQSPYLIWSSIFSAGISALWFLHFQL